jgi:hypothetical protein
VFVFSSFGGGGAIIGFSEDPSKYLYYKLYKDTIERKRDSIGDPCFFCSPHNVWATEETWISNRISSMLPVCSPIDLLRIPFGQVMKA